MGLLRALFAIAVVFQHSPWNGGLVFVGGRNAVQMFYMVSGFLICHVLTGDRAYGRVSDFYKSRLFRLLPMYYAVALISLLTATFINRDLLQTYAAIPASATVMLVFSNLFLFGQDWVMFSAIRAGELVFAADFRVSEVLLYQGLVVQQAWTLGVELCFYLIAPFVLRSRRVIWLLLALSVLLRLVLVWQGVGRNDPWTYRFFPTELAFFLIGALSNIYLLPFWQKHVSASQRTSMPSWGTGGMFLLTVSYFMIPLPGGVKSAVILALFFCVLPLTFIYQNQHSWDRKIGDLSYPIYIGHLLVVFALQAVWPLSLAQDFLLISAANLACTLIFALVLNYAIGIPVERYRRRFRSVPA